MGWENVVVAKGYRPVDRDQQFLLPVDMREWLPVSDPVFTVIDVVAALDTSAVHAVRRTGGVGRAGYDPDMLLTVLIFGWAQGQRSSRVLERMCRRDAAFRIICAGNTPDHVTISRFRADVASHMEALFTQVLLLCGHLGLARLGVVALDGVKISSNASLSANRTEKGLRAAAAEAAEQRLREHARAAAAEHAAADAREDEMFGPGSSGGEVPEEMADPRTRAARIAQALAELEKVNADTAAKREQVEKNKSDLRIATLARRETLVANHLRRREESGPVRGKPPTEIRVEILQMNLAHARARHQATIENYRANKAAGSAKGRAPGPVEKNAKVIRVQRFLDRAIADRAAADAKAAEQERVRTAVEAATASAVTSPAKKVEPTRNVTDPESRSMQLRGGGWIQGYNCQAVTTSDGIIIATSVGNNPNDGTTFTSMLDKAVAAADVISSARVDRDPNVDNEIGVLLADAGYLTESNLTAPGPDRLIAIGTHAAVSKAAADKPVDGPPPPGATPKEAMSHRLRTPVGAALYGLRSHIAETPFGHAKHNLGFRRFSSRGQQRAAAEFTFHALVHNLFKAIGAQTPALA
nr:transposase [Rhodococcus fascians]